MSGPILEELSNNISSGGNSKMRNMQQKSGQKANALQKEMKIRIASHRSNMIPLDHLLLDSAPNLGPLIFRWKINKFENC
jgi:hypothetical protein